MAENSTNQAEDAGTTQVSPTNDPTSPPVDNVLDGFWQAGPQLDKVSMKIAEPETPLALLETLGSSPFPRGGFPLMGFLASTYDRVTRFALDRA